MTTQTANPQPRLTDELRQRIRQAYMTNTSQMTVALARQLDVPEALVLRSLPSEQICELDPARWEQLIRDFEQLGNVHVIVTNGTTTIEAFGAFGNFSHWKNYFNVQTKSLDMHIRADRINAIFAVEKPGHMDGVPTLSFQFYDLDGHSAFKVFLTFGGAEPKPEKVQQFTTLRGKYRLD